MNAGIIAAAFALAQLVLAVLADRHVEMIDEPLARDGLRGYETLGMPSFFEKSALGDMRVQVVMRTLGLAYAARTTVVALLVSLAGVLVSVIVVGSADSPDLEAQRYLGAAAAALVALVMTITLLVRIGSRRLKPRPIEASRRPTWRPRLAYLRDPELLTRYLLAAGFADAVAIVIAIDV